MMSVERVPQTDFREGGFDVLPRWRGSDGIAARLGSRYAEAIRHLQIRLSGRSVCGKSESPGSMCNGGGTSVGSECRALVRGSGGGSSSPIESSIVACVAAVSELCCESATPVMVAHAAMNMNDR
jgi:hypothetical protein